MTPAELARTVIDNIQKHGIDATITLVLKGRYPKSGRKRLFPKGGPCPIGDVVMENPEGTCVVSFRCSDVSAYLAAKGVIDAKIVQVDGVPGGVMELSVNEEFAK